MRNNASTMVRQLIDSTAIISILYFSGNPGASITGIPALLVLIINSYVLKFLAALLDTPIIYVAVAWLKNFDEDTLQSQ